MLDFRALYGMGLHMKRNNDHPGIPANWAAAPEDTGDRRRSRNREQSPSKRYFRSSPVTSAVTLSPFDLSRCQLKPVPASRHLSPLRHEPASHQNRLDLVGFTWIRPPSLKSVRASRHPCPLRHEPTSRQNRLDLVGFTWIRSSSLKRSPRFPPPVPPLRHGPTSHQNSLDLFVSTWISLD